MSSLEYRALLALDIEQSSGRGRAPLTEIRRVLREAADAALERNGIAADACVFDDLGDGLKIVAPPGSPKAGLLTAVIHDLAFRLRQHNRKVGSGSPLRIRVRAALHAGEVDLGEGGTVYGPPFEILARLLDAAELRAALRAAPADMPLALIVSGHYYEDAVQHGSLEVFPEDFESRSVRVKEFVGQAWLFVPAFAASAPRAEEGGAVPTEKELTALAALGAATVVTAMATDAWSAVKTVFGKLFHRAGADRAHAAEQRLETDARLVEGAKDPEAARGNLLGPWTGEIGALLRDFPDAAPELRKLIEERAESAPRAAGDYFNQTTIVTGGSSAITVGRGTVVSHGIPAQPARLPRTAAASGEPDPQQGTKGAEIAEDTERRAGE